MGYIKTPEGVDFLIKSLPLSKEEEKEISDFIKKRKAQLKLKKKSKKSIQKEKNT